jgi:ABC-2 type transport system ATP-binding protein
MIVVEGLRRDFGRVTAVHDLSFAVADGEIFGLLGPNGAGKTTTVRMLAGLIRPTDGEATVNGHAIGEGSQRIRALTGILTESPGLHEKLTARQNLEYYGRLYGIQGRPLRAAVDRYLDVVGMAEHANRRVNTFSKGMRQKIAIARALLHEPEVIYLDEPTSGLDPSAAKTVRDFVATLRELGRSIVVCTHNLDEAERLCDRIGIMQGTLLRVDTPAAMRRHGRNPTVRVELNGARGPESFIEVLARLPFVLGAQPRADRSLLVELNEPHVETPDLVAALVNAGARITGVREESATLEEVYLRLVGEVGERDAAEATSAPGEVPR